MKGIRRSLNKGSIGAPVPTYSSLPTNNFPSLNNNNNNRQSTSTSTRPLTSPAPAPPKRVIRAIEAYRARNSQELSFELGDFFHVVSDEGGEDWFDAANPMTGAKGLVPARCFQVLGRNVRETAAQQGTSGNNNNNNNVNSLKNNSSQLQQNRSIPQQQQQQQQQQYQSKPQPQQQQSYNSQSSSSQQPNFTSPPISPTNGLPSPSTPKSQPLYGIVQYDFVAERADELDAKRGEPIIVIAQSNHEWFVAKPIGRLGGPGLIPVAFVEIQDMTTGKPVENVEELIRSAVVPKVEEWKKMTADYKSASIPLGRFDFANPGGVGISTTPVVNSSSSINQNNGNYNGGVSPAGSGGRVPSQYDQQNDDRQQQQQQQQLSQNNNNNNNSNRQSYEDEQQQQQQSQQQQQQQQQQNDNDNNQRYSYATERRQYGLVVSASVESFHQEEGSFWFHLRAHFSTGASLILYRLYQDFYDFQIALMDEFPVEAGRIPPPSNSTTNSSNSNSIERILPMMPGPTDFEDETVCAQRVFDLSVYLDDLCKLPSGLRSAGLMYEFFATRAGDVEVAVGDGKGDQEFIGNGNGNGNNGSIEGQYGELVEYLDQMDGPQDGRGGGGGNRNQPQPLQSSEEDRNNNTLGMERLQMSNNNGGGGGGGGDRTSEYRSDSRQQQDRSNSRQQNDRSNSRQQQDRSNSRQQERGNNRVEGRTTSGYSEDQYAYTQQQQQPQTHQKQPSYQSTYPSPPVSSQPSFSSNQNQNLPFVKIKIFHRNTDDLIAIRVPPTVTHSSLMEKVRERLGNDVINLRFREEVGANGPVGGGPGQVVMAGGARLIGIDNDDDLDRWIRGGSRLVLYAD